jgi:hypothetical protein
MGLLRESSKDYPFKSCMSRENSTLAITGSNHRKSDPNIPPKDIQVGHEFMVVSLKTR